MLIDFKTGEKIHEIVLTLWEEYYHLDRETINGATLALNGPITMIHHRCFVIEGELELTVYGDAHAFAAWAMLMPDVPLVQELIPASWRKAIPDPEAFLAACPTQLVSRRVKLPPPFKFEIEGAH